MHPRRRGILMVDGHDVDRRDGDELLVRPLGDVTREAEWMVSAMSASAVLKGGARDRLIIWTA